MYIIIHGAPKLDIHGGERYHRPSRGNRSNNKKSFEFNIKQYFIINICILYMYTQYKNLVRALISPVSTQYNNTVRTF